MLVAICRATPVVVLDTLLENVEKSFGKKFARKVIDGNLEATRRGFEEAREG
jgi:pyruvate ferredoxin oxidoreductase gamma subunit